MFTQYDWWLGFHSVSGRVTTWPSKTKENTQNLKPISVPVSNYMYIYIQYYTYTHAHACKFNIYYIIYACTVYVLHIIYVSRMCMCNRTCDLCDRNSSCSRQVNGVFYFLFYLLQVLQFNIYMTVSSSLVMRKTHGSQCVKKTNIRLHT